MPTDTKAEIDNKKRLADVTAKLIKLEADRAWNMSKEGKDANKRLKELQNRIKKQNELLNKESEKEDDALELKEKKLSQEKQLANLRKEIEKASTADAAKLRKADREFQKEEAKLQQKLKDRQRDFGSEFYDSIFGTYSLIGSLKNMFPKPVQILAAWGFDKIRKGLVGSIKGIGKLAKGGFNALFGDKKDKDAPPGVKPTTEAIPKKKLSIGALAKAHVMGKGAAFGTDPETGKPVEDVKPQEKPTTIGGKIKGIGASLKGAAMSMFGGGEEEEGVEADGSEAAAEGAGIADPAIAMDSIAGSSAEILDELKKQTSLLEIMADVAEGPDASKEGEDAVEGGIAEKLGGMGKFGKMILKFFNFFKTIFKVVMMFAKWKILVVAAIAGLVLWLTVKFWKPIKEAFLKVVDWFKGLWTWASEAISGVWTGLTEFIQGVWDKVIGWFKGLWEWASDGIAKGWTNVTTFVKGVWDSAIAWFKGLWAWASDGIAEGWTNVTTFIKGIWDSAIAWFKKIWSWASDGIAEGWTNVTTFIKGVWDSAIAWFKGLWAWASDGIAEGWTNLTTYISDIWKSVKKWFTELFSWGEEDGEAASEGFSLWETLKNALAAIGEWFANIFDIDWGGLLVSMISKVPGGKKLMGWLGLGSDKDKTAEAIAVTTEKIAEVEEEKTDAKSRAERKRGQVGEAAEDSRQIVQNNVTQLEKKLKSATEKEISEGGLFGIGEYTQEDKDIDVRNAAIALSQAQGHSETEIAAINEQEQLALNQISTEEEIEIAALNQEQVQLQAVLAEDQQKMTNAALEEGSLYTHDVPLGEIMKEGMGLKSDGKTKPTETASGKKVVPPPALAASVGDKEVDMSTIEGRREFLASATDEEWAQMFKAMQDKGVAYAGGGAGVLQRQTKMGLEYEDEVEIDRAERQEELRAVVANEEMTKKEAQRFMRDKNATAEDARARAAYLLEENTGYYEENPLEKRKTEAKRDAKIATMDYMFGTNIEAVNKFSTEFSGDEYEEGTSQMTRVMNSIGDVSQSIITSEDGSGGARGDYNNIADSYKTVDWEDWKGDEAKLRDQGIYTADDIDRLQELTGSTYIDVNSTGRGRAVELAGARASYRDPAIEPSAQMTPGNDIATASANMYGEGGSSNNIVNAPVTNSSNSNTTINVQTPKMASDPNTHKQSGYALSGWAKFD
jgi:hypothetical protein